MNTERKTYNRVQTKRLLEKQFKKKGKTEFSNKHNIKTI